MHVLVLAFIVARSAAIDSTSSITCDSVDGIVMVRDTLPGTCTATAKTAGTTSSVEFTEFGLSVSGSNGFIKNINPPSGPATSFSFQIEVKSETGFFSLVNTIGMPEYSITVVDNPSNMSTMSCQKILNVTDKLVCTLEPRDLNSLAIYAQAARGFTMFGTDINGGSGLISWSALTPPIGNSFTVEGTFPYSSVFAVTNGKANQVDYIAALDKPDGTSLLTCITDGGVVPIDQGSRCTITAQKANKKITTQASSFTPSGLNKGSTFDSVQPIGSQFLSLGTTFSFNVQLGGEDTNEPFSNTGVFNATDGVSSQSVPITITAPPDGTSRLQCEGTQVVAGGQLRCTSTPNQVGRQIWSLTTVWALTVEDRNGAQGPLIGKFSSITPAPAGNMFNWTLTSNPEVPANNTLPYIISLNDGKSPKVDITVVAAGAPDNSTTMTCASNEVFPGDIVLCEIRPMIQGSSVSALSNSFSLQDGGKGGTFSQVLPTSGVRLSFSYTVPMVTENVTLSNGVSGQSVTLFLKPTLAPSLLPTAEPTVVGAVPTAAAPTPQGTAPTAAAPTPQGTVPTAKAPQAAAPTPKGATPTVAQPPTAQAAEGTPNNEGGGIGVAGGVLIALALLLLAVGGFFLWRRQKRKKNDSFDVLLDNEGGGEQLSRYVPPATSRS